MAVGERVFLTAMQGKFWRFDAKALVGSVLLGIVMNLIQQVTERADAAMTGGAFLSVSAISFTTVAAIAAMFFRFPGVLITTEVHALIGLATAASPMSPAFLWANFLMSIAFALVVWKLSMDPWWHYPLLVFPSMAVGTLGTAAGLWFILQLPPNIILIASTFTFLIGSVVSSVLTPFIARAIDRSGVLD